MHPRGSTLQAWYVLFAKQLLFHSYSDVVAVQNANVGSYSNEGFVEVLAATQSPKSTAWFQGTADAVRQYLWLFENTIRTGVQDFIILSGE